MSNTDVLGYQGQSFKDVDAQETYSLEADL